MDINNYNNMLVILRVDFKNYLINNNNKHVWFN